MTNEIMINKKWIIISTRLGNSRSSFSSNIEALARTLNIQSPYTIVSNNSNPAKDIYDVLSKKIEQKHLLAPLFPDEWPGTHTVSNQKVYEALNFSETEITIALLSKGNHQNLISYIQKVNDFPKIHFDKLLSSRVYEVDFTKKTIYPVTFIREFNKKAY